MKGHGEPALATVDPGTVPRPSGDHSKGARPAPVAAVPVALTRRRPDRACDESPLAGLDPTLPNVLAGTDR